MPERIETDRLVLSRLRYEDAEEIFYAYASKPEVTKYVSWPTHVTIDDTRAFLKYAVKAWRAGVDYSFAARLKTTNRLIGSIGLIHEEGKVQFGYSVSPTQWGNGFATEMCRKMMALLRTTNGIYRIFTFVDEENVASIKVLQKSGLIEEARLPRWHTFVNQGNEPKDCVMFKLAI